MKTTAEIQDMAHAIQTAYIDALVERTAETKSKYKVGDKVGVGRYSHDGSYNPLDTGTVTKVHPNGEHEVTHDKQVISHYNSDTPVKRVTRFNHAGYNHSVANVPGHGMMITHIDKHEGLIKSEADANERTRDIGEVIRHLNNKADARGNMAHFDRAHADYLKALIDKHVKE